MSDTLQLVVVAAVVAIVVLKALAAMPAGARRALWRASAPAPLSARRAARAGRAVVRAGASALAWPGRPSLTIEPFVAADEAEAATATGALRAAIVRVGSPRRSSVDVVTGRLEARQVVDEVADALSVAPEGRVLAALLRIGRLVAGRGWVRLAGQVLDSAQRGPGLALALVDAGGSVIAATTLWAVDFEPLTDAAHPCGDAREDRLLRLATAGAVWTHVAFMAERRGLRAADFARTLGAADWRSAASLQIGVETRGGAARVTRAHYALAVDRDPGNLVAQFDLAGLEAADAVLRQGAVERLTWIHHELDPEPDEALPDPGRPPSPALLDRDVLHHQVSYKRAAAILNDHVRRVHEHSGAPARREAERSFRHLTADLVRLEQTIGLLEPVSAAVGERVSLGARVRARVREPWRFRRDGEALLELLRRLEGPMLVLWMAYDVHLHQATVPPAPEEGTGAPAPGRDALLEALAADASPRRCGVVLAFLRGHVRITSRTRYNLACLFADVGDTERAWRELRRSLEDGRYVAWALQDPELAPLRRDARRWRAVTAREEEGASAPDAAAVPA